MKTTMTQKKQKKQKKTKKKQKKTKTKKIEEREKKKKKRESERERKKMNALKEGMKNIQKLNKEFNWEGGEREREREGKEFEFEKNQEYWDRWEKIMKKYAWKMILEEQDEQREQQGGYLQSYGGGGGGGEREKEWLWLWLSFFLIFFLVLVVVFGLFFWERKCKKVKGLGRQKGVVSVRKNKK